MRTCPLRRASAQETPKTHLVVSDGEENETTRRFDEEGLIFLFEVDLANEPVLAHGVERMRGRDDNLNRFFGGRCLVEAGLGVCCALAEERRVVKLV